MSSAFTKATNDIKRTEREIENLQRDMAKLGSQKLPTQEYSEVQKQISDTETRLNSLIEKEQQYLATGGSSRSTPFAKMELEIEELSKSLPYLKSELQDLVDTDRAFTSGTNSAGYQAKAEKLQQLTEKLDVYNTKLQEVSEKESAIAQKAGNIGRTAQKGLGKMDVSAKKSGGILKTLASRFKGIALSLLIFNWITKAFNAFVAGVKEGFQNLAKESDDYNKSLSELKSANTQLKNSFAAAFAPIVQFCIPYLIKLINVIISAMNVLAQFNAMLTGASMWRRAKKVNEDYRKSIDKTGGSAKKAKKELEGYLSPIDEINKYKSSSDDSGGGGASVPDMFEDVPLDTSKFDKLKDALKPILDYLKQLKDKFKDGFDFGLGGTADRIAKLKKGLDQILQALKDIFLDKGVQQAVDKFVKSFMFMVGSLVGSMASIGLSMATMLIAGLGKYLSENTDRIKAYLIDVFNIGSEVNMLLATLFADIAYLFTAFASNAGIAFTSNLIGCVEDALMGVSQIVGRLIRDILSVIVQVIDDNKARIEQGIEGALSVMSKVLETVKQVIDDTVDKMLEVYDAHLQPLFKKIGECLSEVMELIMTLWNTVVIPFADWVATNILPIIQPIVQDLLNIVLDFVGGIADALSNAFSFIKNFVSIIIGILTGDWDRVWTSCGRCVQDAMLFVKNIVNTHLTAVSKLITTILDSILKVFTSILNSLSDLAKNKFANIKDNAINAMNSLKSNLSTILNGIKSTFSTCWESISSKTKEKWEALKTTVAGFVDGILSAVSNMKDKLFGWFDGIGEKIGDLIDKMKGLKDKISDGTEKTDALVKTTAQAPTIATGSSLPAGVSSYVSSVSNTTQNIFNGSEILSEIRELRRVMQETASGGTQTIYLTLDGMTVAKAVIKNGKIIKMITGQNPFETV